MGGEGPVAAGPPPLRPFGLVLHHDGRWSHEGAPIRNRRLREHFDRHVRFLPDEGGRDEDDEADGRSEEAGGKFVVTLRHFRGEIVVEEAAFFVRTVDLVRGTLALSDGTEERLDVGSLVLSPRDDALLCRVKRDLAPQGLLARFDHGAHAELLQAVEADDAGLWIGVGGARRRLPELGPAT